MRAWVVQSTLGADSSVLKLRVSVLDFSCPGSTRAIGGEGLWSRRCWQGHKRIHRPSGALCLV